MTEELKRCARCHSKLLLEFFNKNRQGEFDKCCQRCCKNDITHPELWEHDLTDLGWQRIQELDRKSVVKQRTSFINSWIAQGMKYKGKVKADTVDYPEDVAKLKGDELLIEYHKFKVPRSQQVVITRWRLRAGDLD